MKDETQEIGLSASATAATDEGLEHSDAYLIGRVRAGETEYYSELYRRHVLSVTKVAQRHVDNASDAEDMVAEAFASTLEHLSKGRGPDKFFRAYILSVVTRQSHRRNQKASKVLATDNDWLLDQSVEDDNPMERTFETDMVAESFATLPERWQAVLWYSEVERMKPAQVGPLLGLSPNAVSALLIRAKEGLRRSYLDAHHQATGTDKCASYAATAAALSKKGMGRKQRNELAEHARECVKCTALLLHLTDVHSGFGRAFVPAIAGFPVGQLHAAGLAGKIRSLFPGADAAAVARTIVGLVVGAVVLMGLVFMQPQPNRPETQGLPPAANTGSNAPPSPAQPAPTQPAQVPDRSSVKSLLPAPAIAPALPPAAEPAPAKPPIAEPPSPVAPAQLPPAKPGEATPSTNMVLPSSGVVSTDPAASTMQIYVDFLVVGDIGLSDATVTFAVDKGVRFPSAPKTPPGWLCPDFSPMAATITCTTRAANREDLSFALSLDTAGSSPPAQLTYHLTGQGLTPANGARQLPA
ncbi:RNA polymerase sigma factor [Paenarthrobacter nitroguajacolicus]|uniref:RNA polymerase sigma factor n=1 Tax=Paenarthrobacter nitroguajacolicus TaxID=211146 RepID=UPI00248C18C4|nr:sigma-70 family RNA polymerase sigma factor [Paenarthrobacter nitroguajacolicus]